MDYTKPNKIDVFNLSKGVLYDLENFSTKIGPKGIDLKLHYESN